MKLTLMSIVGGMFGAGILSALTNIANRAFFPLPPEVSPQNLAALQEYLAGMPTGPYLMSLAGMVLAGLAGGFTAGVIQPEKGYRNGLIVGAFYTMFAVTGMMMVPHPLKLWISALASYIPCALAGAYFASIAKQEQR
ncbi:MAG: YrzE family protein [Bacteroidetes bacterium]|nr:YrzE family protein [Bacteroidota bacterium]